MDLEISKSGDFTAIINNRYLHSKYDPKKEAILFLRSWIEEHDIAYKSTIIIIEPGLGYLLSILKERFPEKTFIAVFTNKETYNFCLKSGKLDGFEIYLSYEQKFSVRSIQKLDPEISIRDIAIISWKASEELFFKEYQAAVRDIYDTLRILQGNEHTQKHFASRWFINGVRNFLRYDFSAKISFSKTPVLLLSSGPSLEMSIEAIHKFQHHYIIAALPSSLALLKEADIKADILFTTDPGYYAREHLKYLPPETVCVSPITSGLVPLESRLAGFNQNSFIENILLLNNELPALTEMGTVAATALSYIRNHSIAELYIAGLDFCMDDLKLHAQPHSFNPIILKNESRFYSSTSLFYNRINTMTYRKEGRYRFSKSMDTYANWFREQEWPENVYRISPSCVPLPFSNLKKILESSGTSKKTITVNSNQYPSQDERIKRVQILKELLDSGFSEYNSRDTAPALFKTIINELGYSEISEDNKFAIENLVDRLIKKIGSIL